VLKWPRYYKHNVHFKYTKTILDHFRQEKQKQREGNSVNGLLLDMSSTITRFCRWSTCHHLVGVTLARENENPLFLRLLFSHTCQHKQARHAAVEGYETNKPMIDDWFTTKTTSKLNYNCELVYIKYTLKLQKRFGYFFQHHCLQSSKRERGIYVLIPHKVKVITICHKCFQCFRISQTSSKNFKAGNLYQSKRQGPHWAFREPWIQQWNCCSWKKKHYPMSSYWESFTFCENSEPHMLPHIYMSSGISIGVPKKSIQWAMWRQVYPSRNGFRQWLKGLQWVRNHSIN
jgi:hypothetical protein